MPVDPTLILAADDTRNCVVMLSDKTRYVLVTGLHSIREREVWDSDISDAQWDDLESAMSQGAFEIEDCMSAIGVRVQQSVSLALPASTWTRISWTPVMNFSFWNPQGMYDASHPLYFEIPQGLGGTYVFRFGVRVFGTMVTSILQSRVWVTTSPPLVQTAWGNGQSHIDADESADRHYHYNAGMMQLLELSKVYVELFAPNPYSISTDGWVPYFELFRVG